MLILAHRGASHRVQENTLEAFRLAGELGADAVELDARRTADGVIVVHHDPVLPGADRPIVAMTRSEVAAAAPHVPDLVDALAACRPLWVDIEIKNAPYEPDADPDDRGLAAVADLAAGSDVITSFNPVTVARAHDLGLSCGWLLTRALDPVAVLAAWPGYAWVLPGRDAVVGDPAAVVTAARAAGARVGVWTVDDPGEVRLLAAAGVDLLCTNEPDSAIAALAQGGDR